MVLVDAFVVRSVFERFSFSIMIRSRGAMSALPQNADTCLMQLQ